MKAYNKLLSIFTILVLTSCNAKVSTMISKTYPTENQSEEVSVLEWYETIPKNAEVIGMVKVGDSGFTGTSKCTYHAVIEKAKEEARKIGGNAIKITSHKKPGGHSTCHTITADILRIGNIDSYLLGMTPSEKADTTYATLNIFRDDMTNGINYDLYIGKSQICQVSKSFKKTVLIKSDEPTTIWAKTERKFEIPVNFKAGHVYYLRCGVTTGVALANVDMHITESNIYYDQFVTFNAKITEKQDTIILKNDGTATRFTATSASTADSLQTKSETKDEGEKLITYEESKGKKVIFSLDGGYSHRTAPISESVPSLLVDHIKNIKNGVNIGGDLTFHWSKYFGLGGKFTMFKASDEREVHDSYSYSTQKIKDTYTIPAIGPVFTIRQPLSNKKSDLFSKYSLGFMGYTNKGEADGKSYHIKAHSAYLSLEIGYDYWLSSKVGLGIKLSLLAGSFSKYTLVGDRSKKEFDLGKDNKEGLGRLDISFGVRFGK